MTDAKLSVLKVLLNVLTDRSCSVAPSQCYDVIDGVANQDLIIVARIM